ncbi:protein disaggregation chaperone [Escherichia coli]|uniref:Protein disaggregation chaperone n=1 Tax=Escherichia coli TaxID=562 RepID=A0A377AI33_ECOLX|nr:protein disaggregation chaperone [Escherichia coli]
MRLDRLTNKFQLALADAQSLALGHDNQFIEPLHLMSAPAESGRGFGLVLY